MCKILSLNANISFDLELPHSILPGNVQLDTKEGNSFQLCFTFDCTLLMRHLLKMECCWGGVNTTCSPTFKHKGLFKLINYICLSFSSLQKGSYAFFSWGPVETKHRVFDIVYVYFYCSRHFTVYPGTMKFCFETVCSQ